MKFATDMLVAIRNFLGGVTGMGSAADAAKKIHLFKNDFDPDESSILADFEAADFEGYAPMELAEATGSGGLDPLSGNHLLRVFQAVDQQFWQVDGDTAPQTVYGVYITDNAGSGLKAFHRFDEPILVNANQQIIDMPDISFMFNGESFT